MSDFLSIVESIRLGKNFLAVPHVNIDGDDLGCMLALYWGLKKLNKNVTLFSADNIPFMYNFMPGIEKVQKIVPEQTFDAVLMLECSAFSRIPSGVNLKLLTSNVINLDHHPDNSMYGNLNFVNSKAAALGEIIFKLFKHLDIELDYNMAVCIYISILTDCGAFQYSNTTSETHKIVSELLTFPIDVAQISSVIYKEIDFNNLKLMGIVLSTLKSRQSGKIVWGTLTQKMLKDCSTFEENTQYFIDEINNVRGTDIAMLFKETPDGFTKVSLRSNKFPVNELAAVFDGGGHKQASGCTIKEPLDKATETLLNKTEEMFYK